MSSSQAAVEFNYKSVTVLVTGGSNGIGYSIAKAFSNAGAEVHITGTRGSKDEYDQDLSGLTFHTLDVRSREACYKLAEQITELDVLVNNAGASLPGGKSEWEPEVFEESVSINLFSVFHLANAFHNRLKESQLLGGASIVSLASMTSFFGNPFVPGYGAAKAGIVQLTKSLAQSWAGDGIRANAIAAGVIETRMTQAVVDIEQLGKPLLARTPANRFGKPEEVAPAVLFLCSGAAGYITGQTLCVDGGFSIGG